MLDWLPRSRNVGSELIHIYQPYSTLIHSLTHSSVHTPLCRSPALAHYRDAFNHPSAFLCLCPVEGLDKHSSKQPWGCSGLPWLVLMAPWVWYWLEIVAFHGRLCCQGRWELAGVGRQLTMGLPPSWRFLVQRNPHIYPGTHSQVHQFSKKPVLWSTANEPP